MASVASYIISIEGLLKIAHIILGSVVVGCVVTGYESGDLYEDKNFEVTFLVTGVMCFVISLAMLPVVAAASSPSKSRALRIVDFVYHIILGIILVITSSMMLSSAVKNKYENDSPWTTTKNPKFDRKVAAGAIGLINSILYLVSSGIILKGPKEDEAEFYRRPTVKPL